MKDIRTVDLKHLKQVQVIDSVSTALEGSYTAVLKDRHRY